MIQNGVCCFTGHRNYEKTVTRNERLVFEKLVDNLIGYGYTTFVAGGALGFDTAAAEYILKKRREGLGVRLVLILPCANQTAKWGFFDRRRYERIKAAADRVECLHDTYVDGCMQERNRRMVEVSTACVAYCNQPKSGTGGTLRQARERGLHVYNIVDMAATLPK